MIGLPEHAGQGAPGTESSAVARHNVRMSGTGAQAMLFVHGFGCDQSMWRFVSPSFEGNFRTILIDQMGAGSSDLSAFDPKKYASLHGYAEDVVEIIRELGCRDVVFVGHSVSAMIGVIASIMAPELFSRLILVAPSPRYIDDADYRGGFDAQAVEELLDALSSNYLAWAASMAPAIMGNPAHPELGAELAASFCRTDPNLAKAFARVTFTSDNRADLSAVSVPSLILQCADDLLAPLEVGDYLHAHLAGSTLVRMKATGHCPNLSAPEETIAAIRAYL